MLFSNTQDNRVQNKSFPVSCLLNINVLSLLLDYMIKITYFNNYQKCKSLTHMSAGINLCLSNIEEMFPYLQLDRKKQKLPSKPASIVY